MIICEASLDFIIVTVVWWPCNEWNCAWGYGCWGFLRRESILFSL